MSDNQALKSTALSELHTSLGAKMVPFAGFNMPVLYDNLIQEHNCVRNAMGVFDVSHMGEVWVEGPKAYDLIEFITTNDVSTLYNGRVQYSCMPNATGGIVDDLLVYRFNAEKYLLVINAGNIDKDLAWIHEQNKNYGATITDVSPEYSLLAIQGPKATEALQKLTAVNLSEIPYYHFVEGELAGLQLIISCTGYTGAGGFELYVKNDDARALWDKVFEAGAEFGIKPIGLGARDTLRLEKGFCLYGHDINDETSPIEAGLGWITKFNHPFMMSEHHQAIKENKPIKKLVGFELVDRGIPRQYYPLCDASGAVIGEVTSGTMSPSLNKAIGLGYVKSEFAAAGSEIYVEVRGKLLKAIVCKIPFS
ncbi:MAG: glycine cleavage system aminomethyltransferase GcvT [Bacteroidetes bacterium]|nr:glycine cleavage system aminomethyltransferase GcvT [Bacteroidota bacterium]MDA1224822.1 glycine cleavage system aminomethyltransferase GcvT [Bacteroidota bacterium]